MTDILRIFLLFAIANVAFSQYLRSVASAEVDAARSRLKLFYEFIDKSSENRALLIRAQNNASIKDLRKKLFSDECRVPNSTGWYYVLFAYLAGMIAFASFEKFFETLGISSHPIISNFYIYNEQISGGYVLLGLLLCFQVFRVGYRAMQPKTIAAKMVTEIEAFERVLSDFEEN